MATARERVQRLWLDDTQRALMRRDAHEYEPHIEAAHSACPDRHYVLKAMPDIGGRRARAQAAERNNQGHTQDNTRMLLVLAAASRASRLTQAAARAAPLLEQQKWRQKIRPPGRARTLASGAVVEVAKQHLERR